MQRRLEALLMRDADLPADEIGQLTDRIEQSLLSDATLVDGANFQRISEDAVEFLFDAYDAAFFGGEIRAALAASKCPISFRLSKRMTRAAGTTTQRRFRRRATFRQSRTYEIAVSTTLLFQTFDQSAENNVRKVAGIPCKNRVEALQRVMEHELIHLLEMIVWERSSCSAARFRQIARRWFGHSESSHNLITPRENAAQKYGIRTGDMVSFDFDGRPMRGLVNRITKRATILVLDARGDRYSDGKRYSKFYVPVSRLQRVTSRRPKSKRQ